MRASLSYAAITALTAALGAQCAPQWVPGVPPAGADRAVNALAEWDPDGAGPATPVLVLGGEFAVAGTALSPLVATFDPATTTWGSLAGLGTWNAYANSPVVNALQVLPSGRLVAGGQSLLANGTTSATVAIRNGSTWSSLGLATAATDTVNALCVASNGDLIAGGSFTAIGGSAAASIARWNGTTWVPLGNGLSGIVHSVVELPNGHLVAGGWFSLAISAPPIDIAEWDGATWSVLGGGTDAPAYALAVLGNGDVVAAGSFQTAGGVACNRIARWNGTAWAPLGAGLGLAPAAALAEVASLRVLANGDLLAGGDFTTAGGGAARSIARWNGSVWSPIVGGIGNGMVGGTVFAFAELASGALWCGGQFWQTSASSPPAMHVAVAGTSAWTLPTIGTIATVRAIHTRPNGDVVVGGMLAAIGGVPVNGLARWSGGAWSAIPGLDGQVNALASLPNGDLVAAGYFSITGGAWANWIAQWNGSTWSPVAAIVGGLVTSLGVRPNGELIAAGTFLVIDGISANRIAQWNGTTWSPLGSGTSNGTDLAVISLCVTANGDVLAGGDFMTAGGVPATHIARWNGTFWSPFAGGLQGRVNAMLELPNGDVLATGPAILPLPLAFSAHLARWNGTSWTPVPGVAPGSLAGVGTALALLPDGSIVVGAGYTSAANSIARWDGSAWMTFGSGVGIGGAGSAIAALHWSPRGELWVGGAFSAVNGQPSVALARLVSPCPASATPFGQGCSGAVGTVALAAQSSPWLGSAFAAHATGVPANAIAVAIWGFGALSISIASVLPAGAPGCWRLATPDWLEIGIPAGGAVATSLAIPPSPALVGAQLFHQVAPVELGAAGTITAITSSNALALTIGAF